MNIQLFESAVCEMCARACTSHTPLCSLHMCPLELGFAYFSSTLFLFCSDNTGGGGTVACDLARRTHASTLAGGVREGGQSFHHGGQDVPNVTGAEKTQYCISRKHTCAQACVHTQAHTRANKCTQTHTSTHTQTQKPSKLRT